MPLGYIEDLSLAQTCVVTWHAMDKGTKGQGLRPSAL
jgi:hypothetical protein